MGGINSGRRATTPSTDKCLHINLSDLRRDGAVQRHWMARRSRTWEYRGQRIAELTLVVDIECLEPYPSLRISGWAYGRPINQCIEIIARPQPFGGERFFFLCPITGRRCLALVMPVDVTFFASPRGWSVAYGSQREREVGRAYRAVEKLERRQRELSKYARRSTRQRLRERLDKARDIVADFEERMSAWL